MKKGYAILLDSIVALSFSLIILSSMIGLNHFEESYSEMSFKRIHYVCEDTLDVLNKQGVLDVVGEQWAMADSNESDPHYLNATNISTQILEQLIPKHMGYMLTIDGEHIANRTIKKMEDSNSMSHSTRLLVGYGAGLPVHGNVARAYLTNVKQMETSSYGFFGGFVGQGNLTVFVRDIPWDATVNRCCLELNTPSSFELLLNGVSVGTFNPVGGDMSANLKEGVSPGPGNGCLTSAQYSNIIAGADNRFDLLFTENNISEHYVGGGYIHVRYNTSELKTKEESLTHRHYLPGVKGIINIYDSFYVPGLIDSMRAHLHMKSNYSTYLTVGDVTVFNSSGNETDVTIDLNNAQLMGSGLMYGPLGASGTISANTVPIRMGTGSLSSTIESGNADVVLITDLSGSMRWRMGYTDSTLGTVRSCNDAQLFSDSTRRISVAKCLAKDFINTVFNHSGNRISLVGFNSQAEANGLASYMLTDAQDNESLISHINGYSDSPSGGTCVCCAINRAYEILDSQGNPSKDFYIIVMTDGITGYTCGGCNYETDEVLFSTGFEDALEFSNWGVDTVRTYANPSDYHWGFESEGSLGPYDGSYYMGIWGDLLSKDLALNRTAIDVSSHSNVSVSVRYSYEDTESADRLGFAYWDGASWVDIFVNNNPDTGGSGQAPWTEAKAGIPDSLNSVSFSFYGQTSSDSEHVMIDALKLVKPLDNGSCGSCSCSAYSTTGVASVCGGNPSDCTNSACQPAIDDAICASRRANRNLGAEVRTIGFGPATVGCTNSDYTLENVGLCGEGEYCAGVDASAAQLCYLSFSSDIFDASTKSQTIFFGGVLQDTELYPDSYLEFEYSPLNISTYGEIKITTQTDPFDDTVNCKGYVYVPDGLLVSDARITSYSGEHWTDLVSVSNSNGVDVVYRLTDWLPDYQLLGDPYIVEIPGSSVLSGENNTISFRTGDNGSSSSGCSGDNRAIYTLRMKTMTNYGGVFLKSEGCTWSLEFQDSTTLYLPIPSDYVGASECNYTSTSIAFDGDDAISDSVYRLFDSIDFDDDGRIDLIFDEDMIDFEITPTSDIQSLWGPAKFKLMVWV